MKLRFNRHCLAALGLAVGFNMALPSRASSFTARDESKPAQPVFEQWETLNLAGKRCGFDSTVTYAIDTANGRGYSTVQKQEFVIKRMNANLTIIDTSTIVEDEDGGVLHFDQTTKGNGTDIESSGYRDGDDLVVSSRGQTRRYHVPPLSALGPEAVRRLTSELPLHDGLEFAFPTFESDFPQAPVAQRGIVVGLDNRTIDGVPRKLWKISSASNLTSNLSTLTWVDDKGNEIESALNIPGIGILDEMASTRDECLKQPQGAEIFAESLIHPQKALPSPHHLAQATYRITTGDKEEKLSLWGKGNQQVLSSQPGSIVLAVSLPRISASTPTWRLPHPDTSDLHSYLAPSAYLESNTPEIQRLAKKAVGDEKNPVIAAQRIERFVRHYITKKDLNVGFASAEETARSREGDCTEHAVLCAALGRAVGLPTRCVLGFGYIPPGADAPAITRTVDRNTGSFGFHMWAEAWIAPHVWAPMDAALDGFDVGHIAITKSALADVDPLADLDLPVLQLMQNLKITILQTVPQKPEPLSSAFD